MAPILPSAAVDTGDNTVCPLTDQRGAIRPANATNQSSAICDVGAVEANATAPFTAWALSLPKQLIGWKT